MKIWNKTEYDNGNWGLVVTASEQELQEPVYVEAEPYDIISREDAGNNKWLIVCKPRDLRSAIEVLNGGLVRLVDNMGDDLSIVRAARVSYDGDWRTGDDESGDAKLINYLMKNHHTSPFEAVQFTFEIQVPIFLARQWHRHRTWAYNEVSARYTELDLGHFVPDPEFIGIQSSTNKQASVFTPWDDMSHSMQKLAQDAADLIDRSCTRSFDEYRRLLEMGVPRERARVVLPVASYTRYFGSVNLHNLFHFLRLRVHSHAQYEIREYAEALLELIEPVVPVAVAAFRRSIEQ